jgi:hypothetical protein
MAKFSESNAIVYGTIIVAANYNAGFTGDSVCMGKYNHGTMILVGDAAVAGAGVLTMMAGASAGSTAGGAITFEYRSVTTDVLSATADVLGTISTSAGLSLTEANILSGMYVVEWDADDLNLAGVQYNWVTPVLDATGTAGIVTAVIILSEPRYSKLVMPTAVA